mgnify:CR=1 FL=1
MRLPSLLLALALSGCALLPFKSPSYPLPFSNPQAFMEAAEGGGPAMCGQTAIFFSQAGKEGKAYRLWITETRFVLAEYAPETSWPMVVWYGTVDRATFTVSKAGPFVEATAGSPCDWLVIE